MLYEVITEESLWDGLKDVERLLTRNRIFIDRMADVGMIGQKDAIAWGFTGPCGRASGLEYDVRKDYPYLTYVITSYSIHYTKLYDSRSDCIPAISLRMNTSMFWRSAASRASRCSTSPGAPRSGIWTWR